MNSVLENIIGLDVGTKRVGVAIANFDSRGVLNMRTVAAYPRASNQAQGKILDLISLENITKIVVGLPLGSDGQRTTQCEDVERFAERLRKRTEVPIVFFDEFLSSAQAKQKLGLHNPHAADRKKGNIDAVAASIILSEYLEANRDK